MHGTMDMMSTYSYTSLSNGNFPTHVAPTTTQEISLTMSSSISLAYSSATPTDNQRVNLAESGDTNVWISYSAGIIAGIALLEIIFLLVVIICRKQQINKKEKAEEQNVFIVRRLPQNRSEIYAPRKASQESKKDPQSSVKTMSVTVAPFDNECDPQTNNEPHTLSTVGSTNGRGSVREASLEERQIRHPQMNSHKLADPAARMSTFGHPVAAWEDIHDSGNGLKLEGDRSIQKVSHPNISLSSQIDVQTTAGPVMKKKYLQRVVDNSDSNKEDEVDTECVFDELDELQQQMRILSQSIPVLDAHNYDKVTIRSTPKVSRSIPTLLDTEGYKDLDRGKPKGSTQAPNLREFGKSKPVVANTSAHKLKTGVSCSEEFLQSSSQNTVDSQNTITLHKAQSVELMLDGRKADLEPVYSIVQNKRSKDKATGEEPSPIPPGQTDDVFYTAAQEHRTCEAVAAANSNTDSEVLPCGTVGTKDRDYKHTRPPVEDATVYSTPGGNDTSTNYSQKLLRVPETTSQAGVEVDFYPGLCRSIEVQITAL